MGENIVLLGLQVGQATGDGVEHIEVVPLPPARFPMEVGLQERMCGADDLGDNELAGGTIPGHGFSDGAGRECVQWNVRAYHDLMYTPDGRHELLILPDVVEVVLLYGDSIRLLLPEQASNDLHEHVRPPFLIPGSTQGFHTVVDQVFPLEVGHTHFSKTGVDGEDVTFPDHTA